MRELDVFLLLDKVEDVLPFSIGFDVAGALAAVARGANMVRVHDVEATVSALRVWQAINCAKETTQDA